MVRVMLINGYPILREGIKSILKDDFEIVGEVSLGEAEEKIKEKSPDVIIMDFESSGTEGIKAVKNILEKNPNTEVLFLANYGAQCITLAVSIGVKGFLPKDTEPEELKLTVKKLKKGEWAIHPFFAQMIFKEFANMVKSQKGNECALTERQIEILNLISKGYTNREIGEKLFLSETSVKREVREIFNKLGAKDRAEAVSKAIKKGLIT